MPNLHLVLEPKGSSVTESPRRLVSWCWSLTHRLAHTRIMTRILYMGGGRGSRGKYGHAGRRVRALEGVLARAWAAGLGSGIEKGAGRERSCSRAWAM